MRLKRDDEEYKINIQNNKNFKTLKQPHGQDTRQEREEHKNPKKNRFGNLKLFNFLQL